MAKRRRLTPPNPAFLGYGTAPEMPELETKSIWTGRAAPPPIARISGDSAGAAALGEIAEEMARAREGGRLVLELPLEAVDAGYLVRDRSRIDDEEMAALIASLAARGQQTPIEVAETAPGRYGLISGWRRIEALRRLAEGGGPGTVLALLRRPAESAEAYQAMVEENEIRAGLSHYERARIVARSAALGVFPDERAALRALFAAASRARRSKIGAFLTLVHALDGALRFPEALGERIGLQLAAALFDRPGLGPRLRARLAETPPADAAAELALIQRALAEPETAPETGPETGPPALPDSRAALREIALAPSGPASAADVAPESAPVTLRRLGSQVMLSGPGVTDGFARALEDWLRDWLGAAKN
jgi:ParB family transcriptional regulator, chromosome partitioning protein